MSYQQACVLLSKNAGQDQKYSLSFCLFGWGTTACVCTRVRVYTCAEGAARQTMKARLDHNKKTLW